MMSRTIGVLLETHNNHTHMLITTSNLRRRRRRSKANVSCRLHDLSINCDRVAVSESVMVKVQAAMIPPNYRAQSSSHPQSPAEHPPQPPDTHHTRDAHRLLEHTHLRMDTRTRRLAYLQHDAMIRTETAKRTHCGAAQVRACGFQHGDINKR